MKRTLTIMRKEFIHILRDPRTLGLVLFMPLSMLVLLGYAIAVDINSIPTAVFDQSNSAESRRFLERFWQSAYFEPTLIVNSANEIIERIDRGDVWVGITIPPDFAARLNGGQATAVQMFVDGTNPTIAETALFTAQAIGQDAAVEIVTQRLGAAAGGLGLQLPIDLRVRLLYNPDMKRLNFMIPGLLGAILQVQSLFLTSFAIVREREQGTMEQLIVTPIKPWELMLGKILPFVVIAFLNVGITLAISALWFRVEVKGDLLLLLALSLVFLLGSLGLGILISTVSHTQIQAMYLSIFIILPVFILSGFLFPRENMPPLAYYSGYLFPITYYLVILRSIMMKGVGLAYLLSQAIPLMAFSLGVFVISALVFRKRLE